MYVSRVTEKIEIVCDVSLQCWTFKDLKTSLKIFPISDIITSLLLCWFFFLSRQYKVALTCFKLEFLGKLARHEEKTFKYGFHTFKDFI